MSLSSYYGRSVSASAYPGYSDAELRRDLESASMDDATRKAIEAELIRRADARHSRKTSRDGHFKCPKHGTWYRYECAECDADREKEAAL